MTRSNIGAAADCHRLRAFLPLPSSCSMGPNAGKELELTKTLTTLGKPGMQVAVIARRPHGYFITHVEGQAISDGQWRVMLDAQARIRWATMT
jgi:hypothetical protein